MRVLLPKHALDLSPIGQLFPKIRHWVRDAAAGSIDAIDIALKRIPANVAPQECENDFASVGYGQT